METKRWMATVAAASLGVVLCGEAQAQHNKDLPDSFYDLPIWLSAGAERTDGAFDRDTGLFLEAGLGFRLGGAPMSFACRGSQADAETTVTLSAPDPTNPDLSVLTTADLSGDVSSLACDLTAALPLVSPSEAQRFGLALEGGLGGRNDWVELGAGSDSAFAPTAYVGARGDYWLTDSIALTAQAGYRASGEMELDDPVWGLDGIDADPSGVEARFGLRTTFGGTKGKSGDGFVHRQQYGSLEVREPLMGMLPDLGKLPPTLLDRSTFVGPIQVIELEDGSSILCAALTEEGSGKEPDPSLCETASLNYNQLPVEPAPDYAALAAADCCIVIIADSFDPESADRVTDKTPIRDFPRGRRPIDDTVDVKRVGQAPPLAAGPDGSLQLELEIASQPSSAEDYAGEPIVYGEGVYGVVVIRDLETGEVLTGDDFTLDADGLDADGVWGSSGITNILIADFGDGPVIIDNHSGLIKCLTEWARLNPESEYEEGMVINCDGRSFVFRDGSWWVTLGSGLDDGLPGSRP